MAHFIIAYHISLVNVRTNHCNNDLLIFDVKQLNKIIKLYYFYTLKALWDGQSKFKMYCGMSRFIGNEFRGSCMDIMTSLLENKTALCPNFWTLKFFWKIGLDNSKVLLRKLYFLTVKNKLSTSHVVKMLCPKVDIKGHHKLYYDQTEAS